MLYKASSPARLHTLKWLKCSSKVNLWASLLKNSITRIWSKTLGMPGQTMLISFRYCTLAHLHWRLTSQEQVNDRPWVLWWMANTPWSDITSTTLRMATTTTVWTYHKGRSRLSRSWTVEAFCHPLRSHSFSYSVLSLHQALCWIPHSLTLRKVCFLRLTMRLRKLKFGCCIDWSKLEYLWLECSVSSTMDATSLMMLLVSTCDVYLLRKLIEQNCLAEKGTRITFNSPVMQTILSKT